MTIGLRSPISSNSRLSGMRVSPFPRDALVLVDRGRARSHLASGWRSAHEFRLNREERTAGAGLERNRLHGAPDVGRGRLPGDRRSFVGRDRLDDDDAHPARRHAPPLGQGADRRGRRQRRVRGLGRRALRRRLGNARRAARRFDEAELALPARLPTAPELAHRDRWLRRSKQSIADVDVVVVEVSDLASARHPFLRDLVASGALVLLVADAASTLRSRAHVRVAPRGGAASILFGACP